MENPQKVLIVEDENHIAHGLAFNLKREGLEVCIATDGEKALSLWESFAPDLIVLDLMLPKIHGHQVLETIRQQSEKIPILILSAKDQINDKIKGFTLGSDDYLTKPFHLDEFLIRVKRLLKRSEWYQSKAESPIKDIFEFGSNRVHMETYWVETPQGQFRLTEQEMKLLKLFIHNPEKVISKKQLLADGWGYSDKMETRTLDIFMTRLRKYFEEDHKNPRHFISLRNKGIIFYPTPGTQS